ncbi:dinucleotide-utilizing enzyme [Microbacterium sp. CH-015]|jgi:hypothetical protein|uniref:dinucleotide-utilizing enzyme n=1 Tax=Microbacterium sp. CH-015 TaxID=3406734 RepID=UPI003C7402F2
MPNTAPRLSRSIPFWVLVGGSVVAIGAGTYLLVDKLGTMAATLTDGTATGVEVYAGQIWAVLGAILIGAGLIGLALALTVGAVRTLVPVAPVEVVEPPAWEDEVVVAEATTVESAVAEPEAPTPVVTDTAAADAAATDPEAPASATTPETPAR